MIYQLVKQFFLLQFFFSGIFLGYDVIGEESTKTKLYYVVDSICCGWEESDPHAVFGIESTDGYILIGKSIDEQAKENGFAIKIPNDLPSEKLFLHPEEEETFEWSIVIGDDGMRDGFNSAVILGDYIFIAGYRETKPNIISRYLIKVRQSDGAVIWSNIFPSKNKKKSSGFESIVSTNDNGILLTGVTNSHYSSMEGFKSYGNPTSGNAFSIYFSSEQLMSNKPPLEPIWEKEYKNMLTGKSIIKDENSNGYIIAGSSHEPTVAKVIKISNYGEILWEKNYVNHGELTDIANTPNGFILSGHKIVSGSGIDGSVTKISKTGSVVWSKVFGNPKNGDNIFFKEVLVDDGLIFDECWSITSVKNSGVIAACGTGIEECGELKGKIKIDCDNDPRNIWRSYIVKISFDGEIEWERAGSFTFPGEEDSTDLPSTASEWVFVTNNGEIALVNDLDFGIGLEIIKINY